jgi:hypothetical protein
MKHFLRVIAILTTIVSCGPQVTIAQPGLVWATGFGGATSIYSDYAESIGLDGGGNVYTVGRFSNTVDLDPGAGVHTVTSAGDDDIYITKQDASGNFVWAKNLGGTGDDAALGLKVDVSGILYITGQFGGSFDFDPGAGTFTLSSNGGYDIFVMKLDASGNFVWASNLGGPGTDIPFAIDADAAGNTYITGWFQSTADFDPSAAIYNLASDGMTDAFLCKLNPSGAFVWADKFGGTDDQVGHTLALDASGNIYLGGTFLGTTDFDPGAGTNYIYSVSGSQDSFVMKLDNAGTPVWTKQIGAMGDERIWELKLDAFSNIYMVGHFDDYMLDMDPSATSTSNIMSAGFTDIFVAKWDVSGNFLWAKAMGSNGYDIGYAIALDAMNNVYTTGYFGGTADFDPGAGVHNIGVGGVYDIFVSKLDVSGNFVWATGIGSTGVEEGFCIATDPGGDVYVAGLFRSATDFDPGAGTYTLTPVGTGDGFVMRLNNTATGISSLVENSALSVYPNPCTGDVTISNIDKLSTLEVVNGLGQTIMTRENEQGSVMLDFAVFPEGLYFLKIKSAKSVQVKKIIKGK